MLTFANLIKTMPAKKKLALLILDGWGKGDHSKADAIWNAKTPFVDGLMKKYPNSELKTSAEDVGLPAGQMGNSEVGHLNIGAGRVVYQDLVRINKAIEDGSLAKNKVLNEAFNYAKVKGKDLHLMGLVSNGGVHSSQEHLHALCELTRKKGLKNVFIHVFTDGRDTDPKSGLGFIENLEKVCKKTGVKIATVVGRYYAMDRDKRWERVKWAYDLMVHGKGRPANSAVEGIKRSYKEGDTDEFIKPILIINKRFEPIGQIKNGDSVICFNFRTDRCREITLALTQKDFPEQEMEKLDLYYVTMARYDDTFKNVHVIFEKDNLANTLGEVLSKAGKTQLRIAETEKYPHVTFFFSGGREAPFKGEKRIMIQSPKVATYDLKPEMSAKEVTQAVVDEINKAKPDFICLNFANPDMVGHTGDYKAIIKAVETVDACTKKVVEAGLEKDYSFIIIADHGNADYAINADGTPNTAHTTNPVPCIFISKGVKKVKNGRLADIAPTILELMGVKKPKEMTGKILAG